MNTLESLLGMVRTEAFESGGGTSATADLPKPTLEYTTELVKHPDGTLEWVE